MTLKDVIKVARLKKSIKQEDAAKAVGVTVQTYSKWENGKTEPKASQVAKLAPILGISIEEICNGHLYDKMELVDFLKEKSKLMQTIDEFNQDLALWEYLSNHKEFIEKLKAYSE